MNSEALGTLSKRAIFQSAFACSIRSFPDQRNDARCKTTKPTVLNYSTVAYALNLIDTWLPSQNGLFCDAPHRQTVIRLRTS
jgi:hypothetical protein